MAIVYTHDTYLLRSDDNISYRNFRFNIRKLLSRCLKYVSDKNKSRKRQCESSTAPLQTLTYRGAHSNVHEHNIIYNGVRSVPTILFIVRKHKIYIIVAILFWIDDDGRTALYQYRSSLEILSTFITEDDNNTNCSTSHLTS